MLEQIHLDRRFIQELSVKLRLGDRVGINGNMAGAPVLQDVSILDLDIVSAHNISHRGKESAEILLPEDEHIQLAVIDLDGRERDTGHADVTAISDDTRHPFRANLMTIQGKGKVDQVAVDDGPDGRYR